MATFKQANEMAKKFGAELEVDRATLDVEAWLPEGREWDSTQARVAVVSYCGSHGAGTMASMYDDIIELMSSGFREQL